MTERQNPEPIRKDSETWSALDWTLFGGIWLASLLFLMGVTIADPDLWGHTLYGIRALELSTLTERTDPFSYTAPDGKWVNHEWLSEWQFGWVWLQAGQTGLVIWRNLWLLAVWLIAARTLTGPNGTLAAAVAMLVLVAEGLSDFVVFVRPQLATFGLFAVTLMVLRGAWDNPQIRRVWCLPFVMAVWVNMHGGFLAGLGVQAAFVFASLISRKEPIGWQRIRVYSVVFAGSILATFANPYGWELHAMLWHHLGTTQFVREWQPLWQTRQSLTYYVPFLLIGVSLFGLGKTKRVDWIVLACVGGQALLHLRHIALLLIAVFVLLPPAVSAGIGRLFPELSQRFAKPERWPARFAMVGLIVAFLSYLHIRATKDLRAHGIGLGEIAVETQSHVPGMPIRAIAVIRDEGLKGNLITDYGWGQFAIWHLFPECRLAFDGRYRTVYPAELERQFLEWTRAGADENQTPMLDDYPTEIALVPAGSPPDLHLKSRSDWQEIYRDLQAAVFVSRAVPRFQPMIERAKNGLVKSPDRPRWVHFPGS